MRYLLIILLFCLALACSAQSGANSNSNVTVTWDANTESDLAGYNIYIGEESGNYTGNVKGLQDTAFTWLYLEQGKPYFFAVTAYDESGNESLFSQEVRARPGAIIAESPLPAPRDFRIVNSAAGYVDGDTVVVKWQQLNRKLDGSLMSHDDIDFGFKLFDGVSWVNLALMDSTGFVEVSLPAGNDSITVYNYYEGLSGAVESALSAAITVLIQAPPPVLAENDSTYSATIKLRLE